MFVPKKGIDLPWKMTLNTSETTSESMENRPQAIFQTIIEMLNLPQAVQRLKNPKNASFRRQRTIVSRSALINPHSWILFSSSSPGFLLLLRHQHLLQLMDSVRPESSRSGPMIESRRIENGVKLLRSKGERVKNPTIRSELSVFW